MASHIQNFIRKESETLETPSKQTLYYLNRFERNEANPRKFNWNWSAALGGAFWMLYRRMYWEGILVLSLTSLIGYAAEYFLNQDPIQAASLVFLGMQGNKLYYDYVQRQLKKGRQRGGVDLITPLAALIGLVLVYNLFFLIKI